MWIHLPRSVWPPSLAEPADSTWPSESLCQMLAQSCTWKTKSLHAKYWRRILRAARLKTRLSGLMCEPSTVACGVERWIQSLLDSRVQITLSPENEPGKSENTDNSGITSQSQFATWDPLSSSWKTSQVSLFPTEPKTRNGSYQRGYGLF